MKEPGISNELADKRIREVLSSIPLATLVPEQNRQDSRTGGSGPDLTIRLQTPNGEYLFLVEVKKEVQPRMIPSIAAQLRNYQRNDREYFLLFSDFVSERSAEICKRYSMNYLDSMGSCRISLPDVFIEKSSGESKQREKRELRSLFALKSSRILNVLLSYSSQRSWKISELAGKCEVSLGLVSKVKQKLIDEEFAYEDYSGIRLKSPEKLLLDWKSQYSRKIVRRKGFYTLLGAAERANTIERIIRNDNGRHLALSGFSAAKWISPYAKSSSETLYVDEEGEQVLTRNLDLKEIDGANVVIEQPRDDFLLRSAEMAPNGISHTNAVQTFLDLCTFGERGREAADHLLQTVLIPRWDR